MTTEGTSAPGKVKSVGDLLLNGATVDTRLSGEVFQPHDHYHFTVEPATESLAERIRNQAGPRMTF